MSPSAGRMIVLIPIVMNMITGTTIVILQVF